MAQTDLSAGCDVIERVADEAQVHGQNTPVKGIEANHHNQWDQRDGQRHAECCVGVAVGIGFTLRVVRNPPLGQRLS